MPIKGKRPQLFWLGAGFSQRFDKKIQIDFFYCLFVFFMSNRYLNKLYGEKYMYIDKKLAILAVLTAVASPSAFAMLDSSDSENEPSTTKNATAKPVATGMFGPAIPATKPAAEKKVATATTAGKKGEKSNTLLKVQTEKEFLESIQQEIGKGEKEKNIPLPNTKSLQDELGLYKKQLEVAKSAATTLAVEKKNLTAQIAAAKTAAGAIFENEEMEEAAKLAALHDLLFPKNE
ncbi:MAG: hypothetical protein ACRCYZ_04175 [Alphaproteobacteria bacterium]